MKTQRILLYSLVMLMAVIALVGCSNNSSSSDQKQTTISVWAMGEEGQNLEKLTKGFEEKHPDIKVNVQPIPWDNADDKITTAIASKEGPDVIGVGTDRVQQYANAGALLDLSDYVDQYPNFKKDNYFPGAVESMVYDDKIVAIPWYVETRVLFYRTDLLADIGYNEPPKTWEELKDAASKLADRGDDSYGIAIDLTEASQPFMFAWQNGSDFADENGNIDFISEKFVDGIKYYTSFFEEGLARTTEGLAVEQSFKDGIEPMFFDGPWMIDTINDSYPNLEGKWDVAPLPKKVTNTSLMGGVNFSVFHNTDNIDESLKFISYMSDVDTQLEWFDIQNVLPSRQVAWEDSIFDEKPMISVFGEQMESTKAHPQIEDWGKIGQEMLSVLEPVIRGESDLDDQLDKFRRKVDKMVAD